MTNDDLFELNLSYAETENMNLKFRHVKCWGHAILHAAFYKHESSESEDWTLTNFIEF